MNYLRKVYFITRRLQRVAVSYYCKFSTVQVRTKMFYAIDNSKYLQFIGVIPCLSSSSAFTIVTDYTSLPFY